MTVKNWKGTKRLSVSKEKRGFIYEFSQKQSYKDIPLQKYWNIKSRQFCVRSEFQLLFPGIYI